MIALIMGAPGAGKGTQADLVLQRLRFAKISTGDALRAQIKAQTPLGARVEDIMKSGALVSDDILLEVLGAEIAKAGKGDILLDGYPRNLNQAEALVGILEKYGRKHGPCIYLELGREELIARLTGRRVCKDCGASMHLKYDPPKLGRCRSCNGELIQRPDDQEDRVNVRLRVFEEETLPVLEYYQSKGILRKVDAGLEAEKVYSWVRDVLEEFKQRTA